ncbi:MAG TPA: PRC-barrel domain-containing protein [Candidatus Sulfotelmatobacter sp.]|nr:PRC-barrel domain-containing protein [Candidatus Sulfotelmatobacter sp.]
MSHYGTLRDTVIVGSAEDIRGTHLYGSNDDKLGKISDVVFNHSTADIRYVVVDTGGWLSTKKFLVPAEALRMSAKHEDDFETNLTKPQIENFPPFDEADLKSDAKWSDYEGKYRAKWVADPVMHRAETDRNVTPTTKQATGNLQSEQAAAKANGLPVRDKMPPVSTSSERADWEAASRPTERVVPAGSNSVVISSNAEGIGGRWDTFQSRLRERRKEAVASCTTCSGEGAVQRGAENAENLRKAV